MRSAPSTFPRLKAGRLCRVVAGLAVVLLAGVLLTRPLPAQSPAAGWTEIHRSHNDETRARYSRELTLTVHAEHPTIGPLVAAIRAISTDALEQLVIVNDVTHLLVDYDEDERVYGQLEYHATLDEMIDRRRAAGWLYLRDDCDGRAVFAAHLLAGLGIPWRLETSYWKRHAWITARVGGVEYDLLDLRAPSPELSRPSYRFFGHLLVRTSHPPPYFQWRQAWLNRTHGDVAIGLRLGLLEMGSTTAAWRERFSTDWTKLHPEGRSSPWDERTLTAACAGFPYGERLRPEALAQIANPAPTTDEPKAALSAATSSTR